MSNLMKYDWYQTDSKVVIVVMLKNAIDKNYSVKIHQDYVEMMADDNMQIKFELFESIDPENSSHKATPSKVEITLGKKTSNRWESLDRIVGLPAIFTKMQSLPSTTIKVSTQSTKHDWDKITKEIIQSDTSEAQSEEALINLFQKIYSDSNEETRRAMNKSFSESGGTVLSTNWAEVGKETVPVKPPNGTEFKTWD